MVSYDPDVLRRFAERMYSRATSTIIAWTLLGLIVGAVGGIVFRGASPSIARELGGMTNIVIAVIGGLLGFIIGWDKGFWYKLEAQRTLCQLQIEMNTRNHCDDPEVKGT